MTAMRVRWQHVADPFAYVLDVLSREAPDIPMDLIARSPWFEDTVPLSALRPDHEMLARHDHQPEHIQRRDRFLARVRAGAEIPPLTALGADLFLVDGYARYGALKRLQIQHVRVLRQQVIEPGT